MKLLTRAACFILALLFLPALAPGALGEADEAQLTLLVYITGSDLESGGGAATSDITEMLRSGVDTSRVNILLMTGGSRKWWGGFPNDKVCIWQAAGARPTQLWQSDEMANLGGPDMLSFFLNYGCENFPARQYALILWDHGGGPLEGVCYDELYGSDSLSMAELSEALEASPFGPDNQLEWIGFDACLMASVETASVCAPYAKYMIASQETEPGTGWNYSFLKGLEDGVDGAEVGRRVVDAYFDSATETTLPDLTLACVELSKVENIRAAMDSMFGELDAILSPESFSLLSNSRRDARNFGRATTGSDYDLVDLYNLAQQYAMTAPGGSDALLAAVEDAVVYKRSGSDDSCGLSVYYPYYNKDRYTSVWGSLYSELHFSEGYNRYLSDYAELWLGESMADWQGLRATALPPEAGVQQLTMELTQEQVDHYAWAELYILAEFGVRDAYYEIYHMNDINLDTQATLTDGAAGLLSADYEYQALYVTDEEGNLLTDALPYIQVDDTYLVRASLSDFNGEQDFAGWANDENGVSVYLTCKPAPGTDELQITGAIDMHAPPGGYIDEQNLLLTGKQTVDPAGWPWVNFVRRPKLMMEAQDGSTLPYADWPDISEVSPGVIMAEYYSIDNSKPWTLKFCRAQNNGRKLCAQYVVVDTQGERFASGLLPIENPNLVKRYELNQTIYDENGLKLTLSTIEMVELANAGGDAVRNDMPSSEIAWLGGSGLYLRLNVESGTGESVGIYMEKIAFDDTAINYTDSGISGGETWDSGSEIVLFIPAAEIPRLPEAPTHALSFEMRISLPARDSELRVPVHIDEGLDLGNMAGTLPECEVLSETVSDGVTYQLLTLEESEDGSLTGGIRIINDSADDTKLDWNSPYCAINDCSIGNECWGEDCLVPAGRDIYTSVHFYSAGYAEQEIYDSESGLTFTPDMLGFGNASEFPEPNSPAYWGIAEVRKLSIRPAFGERLDFTLKEPFALSTSARGHEESAIFTGDGVSVFLSEVCVSDGNLRLYVTIHNDRDAQTMFDISDVNINGHTFDYVRKTEEVDFDPAWDDTELEEKLSWRVALDIQPEGIDMQSGLGDIQIDFVIDTGEGWQYASAAVIRPAQAHTFEELKTVRLGPDELIIIPAEIADEPGVLVDAMSMVEPQLRVPDDFGQYRVTLGARLPEERRADFQTATLTLCVEDEYGMRICYTQRDIGLSEDGWLETDFEGVLVYAVEEPDPLITYVNDRDGDVIELGINSLKLVPAYQDAENANFRDFDVRIDISENSATILGTEFLREVYAGESFSELICVHKRRDPVYTASGEFEHVDDWEISSMASGVYAPLVDGRVQLELRPAQACDGLKVLFSVRNKGGTGYSLEPMTYEEAIVDDVE